MKVLLLFPMADGQTGPAIKWAFGKLGHDIWAVDAKLEAEESYNVSLEFNPDLVFCSRTYQLTEEVKRIKERFKDATICMWNVDTRASIHEWDFLFPLIKLCDYYFVVDYRLLPEWQQLNPNTFWLPQGLQEEVYHKPDGINNSDILKYECDVSFAGSCTGFHAWRLPYLQAIEKMGVKLKKWGCDGQPQVYNEEHNKMVACSKINLSISYPNERAVSVRDYKILGAGGFLLELERGGLGNVIPMGTCGTYGGIDVLPSVIEYCLKSIINTKEIAERGYRWVHSQATYTHRIQKALEIMKL